MKLLLDENLSRRIVAPLQPVFPGTSHVSLLGLERVEDVAIWTYAKENGYVIVTKDDDFHGIQSLHGHPPKIIHVCLGNCNNQDLLALLTINSTEIENTLEIPEIGFVDLF